MKDKNCMVIAMTVSEFTAGLGLDHHQTLTLEVIAQQAFET